MAKIDTRLLKKLRDNPLDPAHLIVRTQDMQALTEELEARGIKIRRQLKLICGIAIESKGEDLLGMLDSPTLTAVEEDKVVHRQKRPADVKNKIANERG